MKDTAAEDKSIREQLSQIQDLHGNSPLDMPHHDRLGYLSPAGTFDPISRDSLTSADAPSHFDHFYDDDLDLDLLEDVLETLQGYDEMGRVEIDRWPNSNEDPPMVCSIQSFLEGLTG